MKLYYGDNLIKLYQGDCLDVMDKLIEDEIKFDAIITDPPYGTTACSWDSVIPFKDMWERINNLIKDNGAICLFSSQPFTSLLVMSNLKMFKYEWIWEKDAGSNFATVKYQPMKEHENILVFGKNKLNYYPIMQERIGSRKGKETTTIDSGRKDSVYGTQEGIGKLKVNKLRNPRSIQRFNRERGLHPTQKPVKLMEYLINTYTKENEVILDFTCGSGSTLVAAKNLNRKCIGIELEEKYCEIAKQRLENTNIIS